MANQKAPGKLRRELGLLHVVVLCVGAIIGTGIFMIPGIAAGMLGPGSLILWVLVGLVTIPISLCFIELGGMYSHTGGPYLFVREALGDFWGFITGWSAWILACVTMGTQALAIYYYLNYFMELTYLQGMLVSALVIAIFTLINFVGVRKGGITQLILTVGTFVVLLIFIMLGIPHVNLSNFKPLFPLGISALGMTAVLILEPFIGWETVTTIGGEVKNPRKNIPKGLVISTILIILFYSVIVFVALGILKWNILGNSLSPLADVMKFAYGPLAGGLMALGAIVVKMACLNAWTLTTARIPYAMAKDKLFLSFFKSVHHKFRTPDKSLLVQAFFAFAIALSGTFRGAIFLLMSNALILYMLCAVAVIKLKSSPRRRTHDFHMSLPVVALAACIIFFTQIPIPLILSGVGLILIGIPTYILVKIQYDKRFIERFFDRFSILYDFITPLWYGKDKKSMLMRGLGPIKGKTVLDYGCATGENSIELSRRVGRKGRVVALDISVKQIERGVRKTQRLAHLPNIIFVKEEKDAPFPASTFDAIVSVGILSYQDKPALLMKKFRKMLKKGGSISLLDFGRILFFPPPKHLKSVKTVERIFKKSGFKDITVKKVGGPLGKYYFITARK